jgi:hypothetical protein
MSLDPVKCRILIPTVPVLGRLHTITSLIFGAPEWLCKKSSMRSQNLSITKSAADLFGTLRGS